MDGYFCLATTIILGIIIAVKLFVFKRKRTNSTARSGVVILHQFERGLGLPNLSPPCLKLETYLRMTNIHYECDFGFKASKKGKMPWIEYNGQEIADSNFCVEFLDKEFGVDVDEHLTAEQKGVARAVLVMLEENTYWTLAFSRWLGEHPEIIRDFFFGNLTFPLKYLVFWLVKRKVKNHLHGHGIGRHSVADIYGIAEKDLKAASAVLGDKTFLFGDKPCLADASLFALVASFIWFKSQSQCPQGKLILTDLKNLEEHAKRMKDAFYPDWDELTKPKEQPGNGKEQPEDGKEKPEEGQEPEEKEKK